MKPTWAAINNRTGVEVYHGLKEADAARAARLAAEQNAHLQAMAPATADVRKDGVKQYHYECDPTRGRMRARKVYADIGIALARK